MIAVGGSLALLGAGAVVLAGPAQADTSATVYVSTSGSNSADCLTLTTACATVSEGVAAAQALFAADASDSTDATVSIAAGTYYENVTVGTVPTGDSLTLAGHAASDTTIDGGFNGSVIAIDSGAVTVSSLTLTRGYGTYVDSLGDGAGGGIFNNAGTVTINASTLSGNSADDAGGGIYNGSGTVTVTASTVSGNDASGGNNYGGGGGGIYNGAGGTVTINASTLSGNDGGDGDGGGAISNAAGGTVTVSASTLSGNTANGGGGGIANAGTLTVTDSTLSGNSSSFGGAIGNNGTATVTASTLSNNQAIGGGGIYTNGTTTVSASILSKSPCAGESVTDGGYNVADDHTCVSSGGTSVVDSSTIGLGGLAANGSTGPQTQAITASSSAHQLVPTASGLCTPTDERGLPRPGFTGASKCDAGAFELQAVTTPACTTTIASPRKAPLTVSTGTTCVIGTTIKGAITIRAGASLDLEHAKATGAINANAPATIRSCGSTITGGITITGATGPIVIGDPANGCAANIIKSGLTATHNTGGGTISGNKITGSSTISGNTPPLTVTGNHH